jgi:hypothetical protein
VRLAAIVGKHIDRHATHARTVQLTHSLAHILVVLVLDHAHLAPVPVATHVGEADVAHGAEVVLQVLPRAAGRQILHNDAVVGVARRTTYENEEETTTKKKKKKKKNFSTIQHKMKKKKNTLQYNTIE